MENTGFVLNLSETIKQNTMKKFSLICLTLLSIFISYNCKQSIVQPNLGDIELNLPDQVYDYHILNIRSFGGGIYHDDLKYEDGSAINNYKATIGRVLFYDKALSINNSIACASCHLQQNAFADNKALSQGFEEKPTLRNSMGICNLIEEANIGYFWDSRETKIESMVFAPIANHIEMGFERIDLITEKIKQLPYYKQLFRNCYGDEQITADRMRESLGHFLFSIASGKNKFDQGVSSSFSNFTAQEIRGKELFVDNNCARCHLLSTSFPSAYYGLKYANIGLDEKDADKGLDGVYKIPRLKNIGKTAPYMHDGRFKTLDEVLEHYSHNIQNNPNITFPLTDAGGPVRLNFSDSEKADLVAFLKTLDDNVMTTDVKFSSPFK